MMTIVKQNEPVVNEGVLGHESNRTGLALLLPRYTNVVVRYGSQYQMWFELACDRDVVLLNKAVAWFS